MRTRRARRKAEELLVRTAEIRSVTPYVSVHPAGIREKEPRLESDSWLYLHGELDAPVKDVFAISIHVHPREPPIVGTARPISVGAIVGLRDCVSVVVDVLQADFDRLWTWAISCHLKYARLTFTVPKYGTALVVNTLFSSVREE